ncbi:MAG: hypothetical protein M1814_001002 [Vezdaea aestivalis]|nr:MAG: hypothetical protein M1814_001002 [Vezdaea aestivalis]
MDNKANHHEDAEFCRGTAVSEHSLPTILVDDDYKAHHSEELLSYGFPRGKLERYFFPRSCPDLTAFNASQQTLKQKRGATQLKSPPTVHHPGTDQTSRQIALQSPNMASFGESRGVGNKRLDIPTSKAGMTSAQEMTPSPTYTSLPPLPSSPISVPDQRESSSKTLFSNYKASQSSSRLQTAETSIRPNTDNDKDSQVYPSLQKPGSSPDLLAPASQKGSTEFKVPRRPMGSSHAMGESRTHNDSLSGLRRKDKPRPFAHLLGRARSGRPDSEPQTPKTSSTNRFNESQSSSSLDVVDDNVGFRTAPLGNDRDRSFREMMSSRIRNPSTDRQVTGDSENDSIISAKDTPKGSGSHSAGAFLTNLKNSSTKAADGIGKAGKGILTKFTRSSSSGEREGIADEVYVCRVINKPLIEQTRMTRISKRLEDSKDKTEFWMPALPWRCIDYLNSKGCDAEGLYRIPGSNARVKEWQRRFDHELDIDLFEEPELYDINIIGSMFKAWLRDLPDEILPKAVQNKVSEQCAGATEVPQLLKDELSKLPPFNYYLLFAITCHLSLLHSYVEKNRMDFRNLCICFQPSMKIDGFCFNFLVCKWKSCWQGCWTEKEALTVEYGFLDGVSSDTGPKSLQTSNAPMRPETAPGRSEPPRPLAGYNGRSLSSSGSDQTHSNPRSPAKPMGSTDLPFRKAGNVDAAEEQERSQEASDGPGIPRKKTINGHAPTLSPVTPLSPFRV